MEATNMQPQDSKRELSQVSDRMSIYHSPSDRDLHEQVHGSEHQVT